MTSPAARSSNLKSIELNDRRKLWVDFGVCLLMQFKMDDSLDFHKVKFRKPLLERENAVLSERVKQIWATS